MVEFVMRIRKVLPNPLLKRIQFQANFIHPGRHQPTRKEVQKKIGQAFKTKENQVIMTDMKVAYGGGRSQCFAFVYDSVDALKHYELRYRQKRHGFEVADTPAGRQRRVKKDVKNRKKKVWGTAKNKITAGKKK